MGEIHELLVFALSLFWFAGATPDNHFVFSGFLHYSRVETPQKIELVIRPGLPTRFVVYMCVCVCHSVCVCVYALLCVYVYLRLEQGFWFVRHFQVSKPLHPNDAPRPLNNKGKSHTS